MAQAPSDSSTQYSILYNFDSMQSAGTVLHIQSQDGQEILTFTPSKEYQSVVFSSPLLQNGETLVVYIGGSSTGSNTDGLYTGGVYSPGTEVTATTLSGMVTSNGVMGRGMMGGPSAGGGLGGSPGGGVPPSSAPPSQP